MLKLLLNFVVMNPNPNPIRNSNSNCRMLCSFASIKNRWRSKFPDLGVKYLVQMRPQLPMQFKFTPSINTFCTTALTGKATEHKVCVDGIYLNVREEGEGSHIVLCLPGLIGTIETDFGKIFQEIDKSAFRLICWDPPGYGKSRPPARIHKPDFYLTDAKLVAKLMEILGYKKYSILGWSNGGMTGYSLAATFPNVVNKFVMWGSRALIDKECVTWASILGDMGNWDEKQLSHYLKAYDYDKEYFQSILTTWHQAVRGHHKKGDEEYRKRCDAVKCPTLVIRGHLDRGINIRNVEYFAKNIKDCRVEYIPKGGHDLHLTHTQEFFKHVYKFLLD